MLKTSTKVVIGIFIAIIAVPFVWSYAVKTYWPDYLTEDSKNNLDTHAIALNIHQLINAERQKAGISTLTYDDSLALIALTHSEDMARRGYFEHNTPEGLTPSDRAIKADYHCQKVYDGKLHVGIAENLIQGGSRYGENSGNTIASISVQEWMQSEGHKANILESNYDKTGIGVAFNDSGDIAYITQNFC